MRKPLSFIRNHKLLFAYIIACSLVASVAHSLIAHIVIRWCIVQSLMQGVAWAFVGCWIATLIQKPALRRIFIVIYSLPFTLGVILELGSWALLKSQFGIDHLSLILNTNPGESKGFFIQYFTAQAAIRLLLYIALFVALWLALYGIAKLLSKVKAGVVWRNAMLVLAVVWGAILIALYGVSCMASLSTPVIATPAYALLSHHHTISWMWLNSDPLTKGAMLLRERYALDKGLDTWADYQTEVWRNTTATAPDADYNVGVIFGESMIKRLYTLNDTTSKFMPTLKAEADSGRLVQFTDMMTTDSFTHRALRNAVMLSDLRESDFSKGVYFPMLAAKAGWEVDYYSNQVYSPNSDRDLSQIFLSDLNRNKVYKQWNDKNFPADREWLSYVERTYYPHEARTKRLSIYHFLSLHFPWTSRYADPGHISPKDLPATWSDDKREETAQYASAMWETDSIVNRIFQHFDSVGPAVVVWFSDHGEFLNYETDDTNRCREDFNNPQWVKSCFEVPMFVWMNGEFIERHPQLAEQIRLAANRRGSTDNIGHAILYLLGIKSEYYRPELNILSPTYEPHDRVDVQGHNLDALLL